MDSQYRICLGSTLLHLYHPFAGFLFHITTYVVLCIYIRHCSDKLLDTTVSVGEVDSSFTVKVTKHLNKSLQPHSVTSTFSYLCIIYMYLNADSYQKLLNTITPTSADRCTATAALSLKKQY